MKITIGICTWNRSTLLAQTLEQLTRLAQPAAASWEVLVVNNNCTDDTDAVLQRYESRLPLRRLFEAEPGHTHARNCAIRHAEGEWLAWTDDDVLVDPGWLLALEHAADQYADIALFAGPVDSWFEVPPPAWIEKHFAELTGPLVSVDHGPVARPLGAGDALFGANMTVRLDVARLLLFDPSRGRVRDSLFGGDDTDFVARLLAAGHRALWLPSARVRHFTTADRLTRGYIERWYRDAGRSVARRWPEIEGPTAAGIPRWLFLAYVKARAESAFLRPLRSRAWLDAYRRTLQMEGMIAECRRRRSQQS